MQSISVYLGAFILVLFGALLASVAIHIRLTRANKKDSKKQTSSLGMDKIHHIYPYLHGH